jgi:hypothetical protein
LVAREALRSAQHSIITSAYRGAQRPLHNKRRALVAGPDIHQTKAMLLDQADAPMTGSPLEQLVLPTMSMLRAAKHGEHRGCHIVFVRLNIRDASLSKVYPTRGYKNAFCQF